MFDAVNLQELGRVMRTVVTPAAAADGRVERFGNRPAYGQEGGDG